ncbi:hypothetical protein, partial [Stenotrophomonas maltophilia group sp. RNC7]|uniref:hypothetical protein n=1 Tax=Stenotrophomonas maltophilia group sp. RNC7 TaxID=3071467 RepID=UPI0027E210AF
MNYIGSIGSTVGTTIGGILGGVAGSVVGNTIGSVIDRQTEVNAVERINQMNIAPGHKAMLISNMNLANDVLDNAPVMLRVTPVDVLLDWYEVKSGVDAFTGRPLTEDHKNISLASAMMSTLMVDVFDDMADISRLRNKTDDIGDAAKGASKGVTSYEVGTFNELTNKSLPRDGIEIHHVVQKHPAGQLVDGY